MKYYKGQDSHYAVMDNDRVCLVVSLGLKVYVATANQMGFFGSTQDGRSPIPVSECLESCGFESSSKTEFLSEFDRVMTTIRDFREQM